jgi:hypothetical protein
MKSKLFFSLLFLCAFQFNYSQKLEYGGMFNLERTTLSVPNGEYTIYTNGGYSEGATSTGKKTNIGIGLFANYPIIEDVFDVGCELFYDNTSSQKVDKSFQAINLIPFVKIQLARNIYFSLGGGTGFILNSPHFENNTYKSKKIDFIGKASLGYSIKNYCVLELGFYPPATSVVEDYLNRQKTYLGIKVPLNQYF